MAKKSIPVTTAKILYANSAGLCCICEKEVVIDTANDGLKQIGEIAHLAGENEGSARYDDTMTDEQRFSYSNLMLLCPNCHSTIDKAPDSYPIKRLEEYKRKHEARIKAQLFQYAQNTSFAELDVLLSYIVDRASPLNSDLTIVAPKEKILLNSLENVSSYIEIGLLKSNVVADYFNRHPDPRFSRTIINSFSTMYNELKQASPSSEDIFYSLWDHASAGNQDFKLRAAGLSILVYLFEICEVFEKC